MSIPGSAIRVREAKCLRCATPCGLQANADARASREAICPLWPAGGWQALPLLTVPTPFKLSVARTPAPAPESPAVWGRAKWEELHRHSWPMEHGERMAWIGAWIASIPGGCLCRAHLAEVRAILLEAVHGSTWDMRRAGVDAHNTVNRRLGKRELTYEEAAAIWW